MTRINFVCILLLIVTACKSISVQNKQYQVTAQKVVLGTVGQDENFVLEKTYSNSAIPDYHKPIKVYGTPIEFSKTSYQNFSKARGFQNKSVNVNYVDSLDNKPRFLNLETVDEVGLMNLLNDKPNADIKQFLTNQNGSHIVTNVSIAFNDSLQNQILDADELFLESSGIKSIVLSLYKEGQLFKNIEFDEGVVFAYRSSSCCWKENKKYQLEIVDLVEGDGKCPKGSYKSSKKAKKGINYYKL